MRKTLVILALIGLFLVTPAFTPAAHAGGFGWLSVGTGFRVGGLNLSLVFGQPFGYGGTYYRFPRPIVYRGVHCTSRCFIDHGVYYHDRNCPLVGAYFHSYGYDPYQVYSRYAPSYDGYYDGGYYGGGYDQGYYDNGYYDGGYYADSYYGGGYGGGYYGGGVVYYNGGYSRHYDHNRSYRHDGYYGGGHNNGGYSGHGYDGGGHHGSSGHGNHGNWDGRHDGGGHGHDGGGHGHGGGGGHHDGGKGHYGHR